MTPPFRCGRARSSFATKLITGGILSGVLGTTCSLRLWRSRMTTPRNRRLSIYDPPKRVFAFIIVALYYDGLLFIGLDEELSYLHLSGKDTQTPLSHSHPHLLSMLFVFQRLSLEYTFLLLFGLYTPLPVSNFIFILLSFRLPH